MNKLWLIVKREYLTRVKKRTFILATLLTPIGFGLIIAVSAYFASEAGNSTKNVVVVDENSIVDEFPIESSTTLFTYSDASIDNIKKTYIEDGYDILLYLPKSDLEVEKFNLNYYSKEKLGFTTIESLERNISKSISAYKLSHSAIDKEAYEKLKTNVILENALASSEDETVEGDRSSKFSSGIASALSYAMGFMMYMVIFIFGGMVMRSVMEEKLNRIVEVIVSTVKPYQLMLGKLLGVGAVGLTQLLIWMILIPTIATIVMTFYPGDVATTMGGAEAAQAQEMLAGMEEEGFSLKLLMDEFKALNWFLIIPVFIVFFIGGYFIYSSLFAAVGSAISEDMGEAQQFMLPISIPVIVGFIMIPAVIQNPNGGVAVFGSMFPLLSPILMPARLAFNPPLWQVGLSIIILILSVLLFVWVAGRIYRVGIFMHGKKISFKELAKWVRYNY